MGLFDNILICSDWDGTLCCGQEISARNVEKIRYFQEEGGLFTICSGRYLTHLAGFFDQVKPNTYIPTLNGALIVHPDTREVLHCGFVSNAAFEIVDKVIDSEPLFDSVLIYPEGEIGPTVLDCAEYRARRSELLNKKYYKLLVTSRDIPTVERAKNMLEQIDKMGHLAVSSWANSIEIISEKNSKGAVVLKLKERVGAKTLITVGDYENDIAMLKVADISYAVANATKATKAAAMRLTVGASDGAIAAIIDDIEAEIKNSASH